MAIDNGIAAQQPRIIQPLPRHDTKRAIVDFTTKSRPAEQQTLAMPKIEPAKTRAAVETPAPLPAAPIFPRRVAREAQAPAAVRAAADAPVPAERAERGVPVKLTALLQQARGRNAVQEMNRATRRQAPVAAEPTPQVAPRRASVERGPVETAGRAEPVAPVITARPRISHTAVTTQAITQLNARQSIQSQVRTRTAVEHAAAARGPKAILDARV